LDQPYYFPFVYKEWWQTLLTIESLTGGLIHQNWEELLT
jgi:nicotinamide mononucleotide (NMN) deamidase PncC